MEEVKKLVIARKHKPFHPTTKAHKQFLRDQHGKAVALAISSESRLPDYPGAPTFKELGYPDLTAVTWFSLSGPAGLHADIVNKLNAETRRGLQMSDARERLRPEGIEPGTLDPRAFTEFVAAEVKRWTPVVKASGAKIE